MNYINFKILPFSKATNTKFNIVDISFKVRLSYLISFHLEKKGLLKKLAINELDYEFFNHLTAILNTLEENLQIYSFIKGDISQDIVVYLKNIINQTNSNLYLQFINTPHAKILYLSKGEYLKTTNNYNNISNYILIKEHIKNKKPWGKIFFHENNIEFNYFINIIKSFNNLPNIKMLSINKNISFLNKKLSLIIFMHPYDWTCQEENIWETSHILWQDKLFIKNNIFLPILSNSEYPNNLYHYLFPAVTNNHLSIEESSGHLRYLFKGEGETGHIVNNINNFVFLGGQALSCLGNAVRDILFYKLLDKEFYLKESPRDALYDPQSLKKNNLKNVKEAINLHLILPGITSKEDYDNFFRKVVYYYDKFFEFINNKFNFAEDLFKHILKRTLDHPINFLEGEYNSLTNSFIPQHDIVKNQLGYAGYPIELARWIGYNNLAKVNFIINNEPYPNVLKPNLYKSTINLFIWSCPFKFLKYHHE